MTAYNCDIYLHLHFIMVIAETDYCEVEYSLFKEIRKHTKQEDPCLFYFFRNKNKILATLLCLSNWFWSMSFQMTLEW